jgi:hypothetical protein
LGESNHDMRRTPGVTFERYHALYPNESLLQLCSRFQEPFF